MAYQFTIYQSTDSSAPVLTGSNGALITVLDAILKDGYGSKSAAGWTKSFTASNKAVYKQGGGNGFYLRVLDDGSGSGAAREAIINGYETMADIDTGGVPFPNPQAATTLYVRKSTSADATARAWIAFADDRTLYFFAATADGASTYIAFGFGDFYSAIPTDPGRTIIIAGTAVNNVTGQTFPTLSALNTTVAGHYVARDYGGVRSGVLVGKHGDSVKGSASFMDGSLRYPHQPDSLLYLSPVWIHDPTFDASSNYTIRGMMRGLWHGLFPAAKMTHGDSFSAIVNGEARTFQVVATVRATGSVAYCMIETSATLMTNPY